MENLAFWLLAAQVASAAQVLAVMGILAAAATIAIRLAERGFEGPAVVSKRTRALLVSGAVVIMASSLVPTRTTALYLVALEHGPEYAERLLRAIESLD